MPAQYEAIKRAFLLKGLAAPAAKMHAARIYNSQHPEAPVTRTSDIQEKAKWPMKKS